MREDRVLPSVGVEEARSDSLRSGVTVHFQRQLGLAVSVPRVTDGGDRTLDKTVRIGLDGVHCSSGIGRRRPWVVRTRAIGPGPNPLSTAEGKNQCGQS